MASSMLILLAVLAVAALLVLVIWVKMPAFIALLLVSAVTALVAGIPADEVIPLIMAGLGGTLGNVALLVGLGAMLGGIVEKSGGAEVLAETFTAKLGPKRVGPALLMASSIIAIPIFFDVAFIILIPIIYSFAKASGHRSPMIFGLPLAFMLFIHVTVPPHPGIAGSAAVTEGDVGLITLWGLLICIPVGILGYFASKWFNRKEYDMLPATRRMYDDFGTSSTVIEDDDLDGGAGGAGGSGGNGTAVATKVRTRPSATSVMISVLLPVIMIGIGTVGKMFVDEGSGAFRVLSLIGAPAFALLVSCIVAGILLGVLHGWQTGDIAGVMDGALGPAAVVVFVTGAGGVLARVLTETGIGEAVSDLLLGTGMPILVLCFVLAALLRAAQGSATVAAITTAGLLQATLADGDYSTMDVVLLNLAIGCGAICLSHINDSGFWIVTRYLGLSVSDGLKTWTPLVTLMGVAGFVLVCALWLVF